MRARPRAVRFGARTRSAVSALTELRLDRYVLCPSLRGNAVRHDEGTVRHDEGNRADDG